MENKEQKNKELSKCCGAEKYWFGMKHSKTNILCGRCGKPFVPQQNLEEYPSELAIKITEIILNKETNWSINLEKVLSETLQEATADERKKVVDEIEKKMINIKTKYPEY